MTASALLVVLGRRPRGGGRAVDGDGRFSGRPQLAESNFRHQLEADIEPFRGMLLGLFFMRVGMSIDLALVGRQWRVARHRGPGRDRRQDHHHRDPVTAVRRHLARRPAGRRLLLHGWRIRLCCSATGLGIMARPRPSSSPPGRHHHAAGLHRFDPLRKGAREAPGRRALYGTERCAWPGKELASRVFVIGFGRFGQIVNQALLAQGIDATVIDKDVERIRDAGRFGLEGLFRRRCTDRRAARGGAEKAEMICVCTDDSANHD